MCSIQRNGIDEAVARFYIMRNQSNQLEIASAMSRRFDFNWCDSSPAIQHISMYTIHIHRSFGKLHTYDHPILWIRKIKNQINELNQLYVCLRIKENVTDVRLHEIQKKRWVRHERELAEKMANKIKWHKRF